MAYSLDDENQNQYQDDNAPLAVGGGPATASAAPGPAPSGGGGGAPAQGAPSNFVGLDRYFAGNKGAAFNTVDGIAQDAQGKINDANNAIGQVENNFKSVVDNSVDATSPSWTPVDQKVAAGTRTSYTLNPATYSGPMAPDDASWADAQTKVQAAHEALDNTSSASALQNYTNKNFAKNANYTAGASRLDAGLADKAGSGYFAQMRTNDPYKSNAIAGAQGRLGEYVNEAQDRVNQKNANAGPPPPSVLTGWSGYDGDALPGPNSAKKSNPNPFTGLDDYYNNKKAPQDPNPYSGRGIWG